MLRDEGASTLPQVSFRRPPVWKRAFDLGGAVFLLVALSPLLVLLAVYIKCVSDGSVLFRQTRIGAGAKRFVIYKFRTMHVAQEFDSHRDYVATLVHSNAPAQKPEYKNRLIRGAKLLRSLSLDELPQLFNVLIGNMSLIGPRPEVLQLEDYEAWQLRRFEVLPGISGLWQVSGKNRLTFNQMIRLDIQYVDSLTIGLDLRIALKTLGVVLRRHNH
ncbi:MAG: sugar transferase [Aureliella sp.]